MYFCNSLVTLAVVVGTNIKILMVFAVVPTNDFIFRFEAKFDKVLHPI